MNQVNPSIQNQQQQKRGRGRPIKNANVNESWNARKGKTKVDIMTREAEAFYLTYGLRYGQVKAGKKMGITQTTVARYVRVVRQKLALALHKSKSVEIIVKDSD